MKIRPAKTPGTGGYSRVLRNKRVLGATSLALADVTGKAVGFLMVPYLANRMGAAEFGVLNLYLSVTYILTFLISLGGAGLLAVEFVRNGYTSARRLRAANLELSTAVSVFLLVVSLAVSWIMPSVIPLTSGVLIVAVSYMQALNVLELSYYRGAQTYRFAVAGQLAFALLTVLLTILAFELDSPSTTNRLIAIALAGAVIQTIYVLELRRKLYEPASRSEKRTYASTVARFGLSLFMHQASVWIRSSVDRFVVAGYMGLAAAGIYSVAFTVAMVQSVFFTAISQQLQPFFYKRLKLKNFLGFRRLQTAYIASVIAFTLPYYGIVILTFNWLFEREYDDAKYLLPMLLGGTAAQSIYFAFTHAAFYERRGAQISAVTTGALVVHLMLLGALAIAGQVTPASTACIFLASNTVAMLGMAFLSHRTVKRLRLNSNEHGNGEESGK